MGESRETLERTLSDFEEHFCHLYNRAALGESFETEEIKAHASGLLKRVRALLAALDGAGGRQDEERGEVDWRQRAVAHALALKSMLQQKTIYAGTFAECWLREAQETITADLGTEPFALGYTSLHKDGTIPAPCGGQEEKREGNGLDFSPAELLLLQRALSGIFLDQDAHLRPDVLRKLAKAEFDARCGGAAGQQDEGNEAPLSAGGVAGQAPEGAAKAAPEGGGRTEA
jgi:hypothetical protein